LKEFAGVIRGCSGFRAIFPVRNFSGVYRALPGRKNECLALFFSVLFLVLLAVSRTAHCDAYHTSLPSTGNCIKKKEKKKRKKRREVVGMPRFELRT